MREMNSSRPVVAIASTALPVASVDWTLCSSLPAGAGAAAHSELVKAKCNIAQRQMTVPSKLQGGRHSCCIPLLPLGTK